MKLQIHERSLDEVFLIVDRIAREELHPAIEFQWDSKWNDFLKVGNWLTKPDSVDLVELLMRLEEEFNIEISDEKAATLESVEQTVRYIWETTSN